MVEVEAEKAVASREAELRKEVEMMKASTRMEKLKGLYARQQAANAECYAKKREVKGLMALGQAQGAYPRFLLDTIGGNYAAMRDFLMIHNGMFQQVAQINDDAMCGLQPKISI
ncbi:flotillin-like protein 4 [Pyrus ussuriensis x Pyrus communis]|uniref:Flotillin-like n=1 Tax=Pyrus ussuriensis x Pyrus communis TaxID=2448454 RepID=A0A5N5HJ47_9ROSA|nr:flotillin-like protein 4 [Pyrus ussuriensis x Pyrus communis]